MMMNRNIKYRQRSSKSVKMEHYTRPARLEWLYTDHVVFVEKYFTHVQTQLYRQWTT